MSVFILSQSVDSMPIIQSIFRINVLLGVFLFAIAPSTLQLSLLYLFCLLEPTHRKVTYILLYEVRFTQTFAPFTAPAFSSLNSLLHHSQIHPFHMFHMIRLDTVSHESRNLLVIGRYIDKFIQSFQEFQVFFLFPRNVSTDCSIFGEFQELRHLKHFIELIFHILYLLLSIKIPFFLVD